MINRAVSFARNVRLYDSSFLYRERRKLELVIEKSNNAEKIARAGVVLNVVHLELIRRKHERSN